MGTKKGRTIWVSDTEFAMINESKELFKMMTGVKISWGAYLTALSMGAITAKALSGLLIRCPGCGREVEMLLVKPKLKY
jgi:hypothetical protein